MSSEPRTIPIDPLMRAADGDRPGTAFDVDAVYRANRRRLIGLATAVVLDRDLAEEIVHDAFVGLQRHHADVVDPVAYLQRTVVNLGINRQRRRLIARRFTPPVVPETTDPEHSDVWTAVARLPVRQRAVVVLRFWLDYTVPQIAETLGQPPGTVKSTLHRALRDLEEALR